MGVPGTGHFNRSLCYRGDLGVMNPSVLSGMMCRFDRLFVVVHLEGDTGLVVRCCGMIPRPSVTGPSPAVDPSHTPVRVERERPRRDGISGWRSALGRARSTILDLDDAVSVPAGGLVQWRERVA